MSQEIPESPFLPASTGSLEVHSLGLVDFNSAWGLQERLVYELSGRTDRQGALLLCEHPPLVTMGREASMAHLNVDRERLQRSEVPIRWIGRGGGAFVHVPGQLAAYLLLPLDRLQLSVVEYRRRLETSLLRVCREQRLPVKRREDAPGLWSRGGQVALFGAAVRSGITCHGMFLNVTPQPGLMRWTQPAGAEDRVTSLQALTRRPVDMATIRESVARNVADLFEYETMNFSTGHPLLQRTRQRACLHA